jgi:hypothetical protein
MKALLDSNIVIYALIPEHVAVRRYLKDLEIRARVPIKILDCANIATSFPGFTGICERLGMEIKR